MRKVWIAAAVVLTAAAVVALVSFVTRPPRAAPLAAPSWTPASTVVSGAYHIHSRQSDGSGSLDEIAAAAAGAGLQFVIVTDHGDGTRAMPASYRHGVLCIEGVEISTNGGHYVALGMRPSTYPLGGSPAAVVEDVARLGGFGIAAHPTSPKPELRWTGWTLPFDGLEWLNADSQWRGQSDSHLLAALLHYPFGPAAALTALFTRPSAAIAHWDELTRKRRVVALAGADAHARIGLAADEPRESSWFVRLPDYESSFRAFSNRVVLPHPFSGEANTDAAAVLSAIRAGHVFTVIDGLARPAAFQFEAESGSHRAIEGDDLLLDGPVDLHVQQNDPAADAVLFRDGAVLAHAAGEDVTFHAADRPGVYRVEMHRAGADGSAIPWILSNPIYVRQSVRPGAAPANTTTSPSNASQSLMPASDLAGWSVEHDDSSRATLARASADGRTIAMTFALGGGPPGPQFVAAVRHVDGEMTQFDRLAFTAQASEPLRLFVQIRDDAGHRWRRSVFISPAGQSIEMSFSTLDAVAAGGRPPNLAQVHSILFVIDVTNARPGLRGTVRLSDVRLER
ncbi:MAG TPA: CehA/McbA family metallohydrolase [Vicinamibacterales bacterium]